MHELDGFPRIQRLNVNFVNGSTDEWVDQIWGELLLDYEQQAQISNCSAVEDEKYCRLTSLKQIWS